MVAAFSFLAMEKKLKSLNRLLSQRGFCSRKEAEALIRAGKVKANGQIIREPFRPVPIDAALEIEGKRAPLEQTLRYVAMNKRRGIVTSANDERGRATVYDDLRTFLERGGVAERLFAVGRLDKDTDGLLLFTNDNHFADFLANPENRVPKTYRATLARPLSDATLAALANGVQIEARGESYLAKPESFKPLSARRIELTLTEGKNREARRIFEALGNKVKRLTRIRFGNLDLQTLGLNAGEATFVKKDDVWRV